MWDLILDAGGALIIAVYGYIQLIHEKKGLATAAFEKDNDSGEHGTGSEHRGGRSGSRQNESITVYMIRQSMNEFKPALLSGRIKNT